MKDKKLKEEEENCEHHGKGTLLSPSQAGNKKHKNKFKFLRREGCDGWLKPHFYYLSYL